MSLIQKLTNLIDFISTDTTASDGKEQTTPKDSTPAALIESPNELLVFGYIRIIEDNLTYQQIIPLSIIQMVMTYYYIVGEIKIILSTTTNNGWTHTIQYIDFQQEKSILFDITQDESLNYNLNNSQQTNMKQTCYIDSVQIPVYLTSTLKDDFFKSQHANYSAIINDAMCITYFPRIEINNVYQEIKAFQTRCPRNVFIKHDSKYREYIYSESHGLICYDGNILSQTFFDAEHTQSFDTWKWNKLASSSVKQKNACLCWIKTYSFDSSENDELFICGGDYNTAAHLFKIKDKQFSELSSMPNARTTAGSYYDIYNKRVYIGGGGHGSTYSVDCYDFNTNKWLIFPDTLYPHSLNPILWMDGYNLFICGHQGNIGSVERYDIRSNSNHWSLADKGLQIDNIIIPCEIERVMSNQI